MKIFQREEHKAREKSNEQCDVFKELEAVCCHYSMKGDRDSGDSKDEVSCGP